MTRDFLEMAKPLNPFMQIVNNLNIYMLIVLFRQTNAQYEEVDILERLDVRLLEIQPGDSGWDVFSLDYKVNVSACY